MDLACVGDLDLDGIEDIVVRTQFEGYAVSGRTGKRAFAVDGRRTWAMRVWEQHSTIAELGDVDGDSRPDFALAWTESEDPGRAVARVHSGRTGETLAEFDVESVDWWMSLIVAGAGDLDGDGRGDLLLGMPWRDHEKGLVRAISSAGWKELWTVTGISPHQRFGSSCTSLGDQDGDGKFEIAIGAPSSYGKGSDRAPPLGPTEIVIVSGSDGSVKRRIDSTSLKLSGARGLLGRPLVACADLDGDSKRDLFAGWMVNSWAIGDEPVVLSLSSATASRVMTYFGVQEVFDLFGESLANVGDVDGDGSDDVAIGDREANVNSDPENRGPEITDCGRVKLYSGRDGRLLRTWGGVEVYGRFGAYLCRAGDLNGDRVPDVWIAELDPPRLHAVSSKDGSYLRRIDLEALESPRALGPLGR